MHICSRFRNLMVVASVFASLACGPLNARSVDPALDVQKRLSQGEIVVGLRNEGATRFVTGTVVIDESPDKVWPILVNPYEFKGKISPRMKSVDMLVDKANVSVMKVTLDVSILMPNFTYTVESNYENGQRIAFHRVGGTLKDFKGAWEVSPIDGGAKTQLTYSMYVDPGFFVPQWIVREGMKGELPRTLKALRERVEAIGSDHQLAEAHTILAAGIQKTTANSAHQQTF